MSERKMKLTDKILLSHSLLWNRKKTLYKEKKKLVSYADDSWTSEPS